jgi:glyoxylase-like metal-dependent hydrolase (beta-lactamase superfamily II)
LPPKKRALSDVIEENSLKPTLLLNTHCHLDHIFGNRFVHRKYGLLLHLHPDEKPVLDYGPPPASFGNCL